MRTSLRTLVVAACLACCGHGLAEAGTVTLTIRDGRVTLVARDATVRQILAEWARVGKTRIVNLENVPGGPVSLDLSDVPESQALRIVLRSLGGFMAAPRAVPDATLSRFDRIVVMPVVATAAAPASSVTLPQRPGNQFQPGMRPGGMGAGENLMGRPRRMDPGGEPDTDPSDDDDQEGTVNPRVPMNRPPLGLRPMGGQSEPASGDNLGAEQSAPGRMPTVPGMITPGAMVARPGLVPAPQTPAKPPGEIR
ncbi:MAG: hypothetical protein Q7V01_11905 [Vicinamibacterales bacterium]|nr:hypothetical protein [Vicinamibacterales bacterium]